MPTPEEPSVPLLLTPSETRLVMKLIEANDSGALDRRGRLGGTRLRVSLAHKVYQAVDTLADAEPDEDTEPPA